MRIEDLHQTADRAWKMQLAIGVFAGCSCIVLPFVQFRGTGAFLPRRAMSFELAAFALIVICLIDVMWRSWRGRTFLLGLTVPLTVAEFRRLKAQEHLQTARTTFFLLCSLIGLWTWELHGLSAGAGSRGYYFLLAIPAAAFFRAKRELSEVNA